MPVPEATEIIVRENGEEEHPSWLLIRANHVGEEEFISMCMAVTKARGDIEGMIIRAAQQGTALEAGSLPVLEIEGGES